jgi:hypothetical protein
MSFDPVMPPYNASDPTARFLSASCLDFLLIELVPMAYRVTNELEVKVREEEVAALAREAGSGDGEGDGVDGSGEGGGVDGERGGDGSVVTGAGTVTVMDEEEEREAAYWRLEKIGYRVGQGLVER